MSSRRSSDAPPPPKSDNSGGDAAVVNGESSSTEQKHDSALGDQAQNASKTNDALSGKGRTITNGLDDGPDSEAETLIDSPVKRREAEKDAPKTDRPAKNRIGSLPVPGEDDDESDSRESPIESVEPNGTSNKDGPRPDLMDVDSDKENASSDALSSPRSTGSNSVSRRSSHSRAFSERPELARESADSPNPRKRKHRASSVSLPNKRPSKEASKRGSRGVASDHAVRSGADRSTSPKLRSHRRAVSTQSAIVDGIVDTSSRRRSKPTARDTKNGRNGWEESDASSETTSLGNIEPKRATRGVGRSTSTPGRPVGREHKRHVNKYGFTRLAEACEAGDLDAVKEWRDKDPDQLELAEFAQNKPLQIAALNGNDEVVAYLIDQGCQIDCANVDKDTPLIDAAENGHLEVVKILLNAGVDPLRQNLKGQQALDVITDDTDDANQIRAELRRAIESWNSSDAKQRREEEEVQRHQAGTNKGLHFMARSYENMLKLVTNNDRSGVREFLDARVPVDNAIVAAAAKTGDLYLVNMLLAEMTEKKAYQKAEKPMLAVLGTSHFEMVKALTELDQFNPLYKSRAGKTWPELADEKNGPNAKLEKDLLQRLFDKAYSTKARRSSSPVVKRENGKRRHTQPDADDDDSEDGEVATAPKRKNGRRLMSRRDMRVASGKTASGSESEESSSETEITQDERVEEDVDREKMKPPTSPASRRANGARRKSLSTNPPENVVRTRRRSSSLRENKTISTATESHDENMDENVTVQIERDTRPKRKGEASTEADAESKAVEDAKAAALKQAEEDARKAEEAEAEAARKAEQENRDEEQRQKEAREQAHHQLQLRVLEGLPTELEYALKPAEGPSYVDEAALRRLLSLFTPLLLTKESDMANGAELNGAHDDAWVLNAQAAPLLGKRGLELLLPRSSDAHFRSLTESWSVLNNFSPSEEQHINAVLEHLVSERPHELDENAMDVDMDSEVAFEEELQELATAYNSKVATKRKFADSDAELYCVRLADVLRHLDPVLDGIPIQVQSLDWPRCCASTARSLDIRGMESVVERFSGGFWNAERTPYRIVNDTKRSANGNAAGHEVNNRTEVTMIRDK